MKRKNPDFNKARKFIRKTKFSENLLSTSYLYIKLFFLWFIVVVSDFLIEFRFEYLWPFYLCVRNVYDIFKYQGFAFSAFFVFITLTSNAICFFLMPVQWLFFTASTYVWFQYVWNSEKGICLQTFTVWLIFVYVEAVRLKELKNMPSHLDLCRPMAAWCIGYPFVSFGFGFKKYLNYRIMSKRQKDVQMENELLFHTINKLHIEQSNDSINNKEDELSNPVDELNNNEQFVHEDSEDEKRISNYNSYQTGSNLVLLIENIIKLTIVYLDAIFRKFISLISYMNRQPAQSSIESSSFEKNSSTQQLDTNHQINTSFQPENSLIQPDCSPPQLQSDINEKDSLSAADLKDRDRLKKIRQENKNEMKKLKSDLQSVRQSEADYKDKLNKMQTSRNELKFQCSKLQHDNAALQTKLQNFVNTKQQDKNLITELERKLQDERKAKIQLEKQVIKYSKVVECGEACRQKRIEYDECLNRLREELRLKDVQFMKLSDESMNDKQLLLAAIDKMRDRTQQLDNNLKEETRLKLELFSVLGETRRQLEMNQILLFKKTNEVDELNSKISEIMAVLPMSGHDPYSDINSSIFLPNFIGGNNKQTCSDTIGSSLLNSSKLQQHHHSNNIQSNVDSNNLSNNSNLSAKTSSSSNGAMSAKGSLSEWKNLNSLDSTGDLTPKSPTTSDL